MSAKNEALIRQWAILRSLECRGQTLIELAVAVNGSIAARWCVRTIRRDLETLEGAGFAIYSERHDDGAVRWHLLTKGVTPARRAS